MIFEQGKGEGVNSADDGDKDVAILETVTMESMESMVMMMIPAGEGRGGIDCDDNCDEE